MYETLPITTPDEDVTSESIKIETTQQSDEVCTVATDEITEISYFEDA